MKVLNCRVRYSKYDLIEELVSYNEVALTDNLLKKSEIKKKKNFPFKLVICKKRKHLQINFNPNSDLLFKNYFWKTGVFRKNIKLIKGLMHSISKKIS